jgi:hypothetical protein
LGSKRKNEPSTSEGQSTKKASDYRLGIPPSEETYSSAPGVKEPYVPIPKRDLSLEIDVRDLQKLASQINEFLRDIGLEKGDILDAWHFIGGNEDLANRYGTPVSYLVTAYWDIHSRDSLSEIFQYEHHLILCLMLNSSMGFDCDWKTFDEDLLEGALRRALYSFGVDIEFSNHGYDEDFTITVSRGDLVRTADVDQSNKDWYLSDKMEVVADLVADFGLVYLDLSVKSDPSVRYFLFEKENLRSVREKYGQSFDEALTKL